MGKSELQQTEMSLLRSIASSLEELVIWTRAMGYSSVRETLQSALDTDEKRRVYAAMDGRRGVQEIYELTGVNSRYISEWGQAWERLGIAVRSRTSQVKGRRERAFDPLDFGISVPDVEA
jgi:hypothetical protein